MIYLGMMTKENWASMIHGAQLQVVLKIQDERCYQGSSNVFFFLLLLLSLNNWEKKILLTLEHQHTHV